MQLLTCEINRSGRKPFNYIFIFKYQKNILEMTMITGRPVLRKLISLEFNKD